MSSSIIPYIIHESPTTAAVTRITEEKSGRIVAEAVLQDMDTENRNHRIYTSKELLPQLVCERTKELLDTGNMKGENGHPLSDKLERQQTIDPMKVCCKYLKLWNEGKLIKGLVTGTNNELGDDFNRDLMDGEKPSFSLRALGTLSRMGGKSYVKNLRIITWDRVIYPSHKRAYTEKLVQESASMNPEETNEFVVQENYSGRLIPIQNQQIIDYIKQESSNLDIMMEAFGTPSYDNVVYMENGSLRLFNEDGSTVIMKPEEYISREIREYCSKV